jgi:hypothetical protein
MLALSKNDITSHIHYSSVRDKIKQQYESKKNTIKNQRSDASFYNNFMNINNFIQEQQLHEQVRRIKTEI